MLKPGGYGLIITPGEKDVEFDTFTCAHCCRVVRVAPGDEMCGCRKCGYLKRICDACEKLGTCRPFEKWLDEQEKKIEAAVERDRVYGSVVRR